MATLLQIGSTLKGKNLIIEEQILSIADPFEKVGIALSENLLHVVKGKGFL